MKAHYEGPKLIIELDVQCEHLDAPDGKKWLACSFCGTLKPVDRNVVSFTCPDCEKHLTDGEEYRHCEKCQELTWTEMIPMMGYSSYLCRKCAAAAYHEGDAI